jgi:urease accessory protein UreH
VAGLVLHDRFVLGGGPAWPGLGFAEGRPYFATVVLVADTGVDDVLAELPAVVAAIGGATVGGARLARRGALLRCLATGAPALADALEAVWALARRRLLRLPPLALRKL